MALSQETRERNKGIGSRIKNQRLSLGLTQRELAEALDLPNYTVISQFELGQATLPPDRWVEIAKVLLMDPRDFAVDCVSKLYPSVYRVLFDSVTPPRVVAMLARNIPQTS